MSREGKGGNPNMVYALQKVIWPKGVLSGTTTLIGVYSTMARAKRRARVPSAKWTTNAMRHYTEASDIHWSSPAEGWGYWRIIPTLLDASIQYTKDSD